MAIKRTEIIEIKCDQMNNEMRSDNCNHWQINEYFMIIILCIRRCLWIFLNMSRKPYANYTKIEKPIYITNCELLAPIERF